MKHFINFGGSTHYIKNMGCVEVSLKIASYYVHLVPMLGNQEVHHKVKLCCLSFFLKGLHAPDCVKCTILQVHRVKIHSGM